MGKLSNGGKEDWVKDALKLSGVLEQEANIEDEGQHELHHKNLSKGVSRSLEYQAHMISKGNDELASQIVEKVNEGNTSIMQKNSLKLPFMKEPILWSGRGATVAVCVVIVTGMIVFREVWNWKLMKGLAMPTTETVASNVTP